MAAAETEKKENNKITLFNAGTKFVFLTKGSMKSYYQAETFKGLNTSEVQDLADKGFEISIRPATQQEMNWCFKELGKYHYNDEKNGTN